MTVVAFGAVMLVIGATSEEQVQSVAGAWKRLNWATTAWALNGVPSWNWMPVRTVMVQVLKSGLLTHLVASEVGTSEPSGA